MKIYLVFLAINTPQDYNYNYGLGYIAGTLKRDGHEVRTFALETEADIRNFYDCAQNEKPRMIGFSVTSSQFCHLKEIVKNVPRQADTFLVAGGAHPTLDPKCLNQAPELSGIVRGEGEYPMSELARALETGADYSSIKNFWFKKDGRVIQNDLRPVIQDLDHLPFPEKDSAGYQEVLNRAGGRNRFVFSRGCPFHCTYCSNRALAELYGKGYLRRRSPKNAIEEIRNDANRFKFQSLSLDDDMVTLDKEWFYEFFPLYAKEFSFPFDCNIRPGHVDEDMVVVLKKAGAEFVNIGVEHGNEQFRRDVMKRNMTNDQIVQTFEMFRKHGIGTFAHVMVGLPYETKDLFWDTVKLFRRLGIRWNYISIFNPYPGTDLWDLCEAKQWLPERTGYREREEAAVSFPMFSKEEIQQCHDLFPILLRWPMIPDWLKSSQKLWAPLALGLRRFSQGTRCRIDSLKKAVPATPLEKTIQ